MENRFTQRRLKKDIAEYLLSADTDSAFKPVLDFPERRSINALLTFFFDKNPIVKWRAVSAVGMVIDQLANKDIESARVIMRRLMWTLNDESGGIGWGSPEAMGDAMARNIKIAKEYHQILISYMIEDQNYLEHEILQRGVLWGIGRLAHAHSEWVRPAAGHLNPFMQSADANHRGLAVWAAWPLQHKTNLPYLMELAHDSAIFSFYDKDYTIKELSVSQLAKQAVARNTSNG